MKKVNFITVLALFGFVFFVSCSNDDDTPASQNLTLNIDGLDDLGPNFKYEGWIMVDNVPVSTGVFTVGSNGILSQTLFPIAQADLVAATKFILTIEPFPDANSSPSSTHILAGTFSGSSASLTIGAPEALGNSFTTASGSYVLATPSDGSNNNENSGVWFLGSLPPAVGLSLPTLPDGWQYEGWAVIDGTPVTTGTFTNVSGADAFSGFSGPSATPPFPGEDFIVNAPDGLTFPTDLAGGKAVISIEPYPDNSPSPFLLKPLVGNISSTAVDHIVYPMDNNATGSSPTGSAAR
tara:strand:- start:1992 stop:2873 length:882 start_codon:yes stop_codon:yes gene_type:complete